MSDVQKPFILSASVATLRAGWLSTKNMIEANNIFCCQQKKLQFESSQEKKEAKCEKTSSRHFFLCENASI